MNITANRRVAMTAGVLFVVATAASLLGTAVEQPLLAGGDYLGRIADNLGRLSTGGLFEIIAAGTSAAIAISLYPILKRSSMALALGAVVFRAIEGSMYAVGAVCMLSLAKVAEQSASAAPANRATLQAVGDSLLALRQEAILAGVFAFVVGALMYYAVFYRSRLVPRWLAGWGIVAEVVMLSACLAALFSGHPVTSYTLLALPIAVQEIVLAIWLMARGFGDEAMEPLAAGMARAA